MRLSSCYFRSLPFLSLLLLLGVALPLVSAKGTAGNAKTTDMEAITATLAPPSMVTVKPTPAPAIVPPTPAMIRNLPPVKKSSDALDTDNHMMITSGLKKDDATTSTIDVKKDIGKVGNEMAVDVKPSAVNMKPSAEDIMKPSAVDMKPMHVAGFITRSGDIFEVSGKNAIGIIEGRQAPETSSDPNICNYGSIVIYSDVPCDEVTNVQVTDSSSGNTNKVTASQSSNDPQSSLSGGAEGGGAAADSESMSTPINAAASTNAGVSTANNVDPDSEIQHEIDLLDELDEIDRRRRMRRRKLRKQQEQNAIRNRGQRRGQRRRGGHRPSRRRGAQQMANNNSNNNNKPNQQRRRSPNQKRQFQQRPNRRRQSQMQQRPNRRRRVTGQQQRQQQRRRQQQQWADNYQDY